MFYGRQNVFYDVFSKISQLFYLLFFMSLLCYIDMSLVCFCLYTSRSQLTCAIVSAMFSRENKQYQIKSNREVDFKCSASC